MHSYYANVVLYVDLALLCASIALAVAAILFAVVREYIWQRRNLALLNIKNNVYGLIMAGPGASDREFERLVSGVSPQQFLDIATNRNRELIFFNASEQTLLKKYYVSPKKIKYLIKLVNRRWWNKWRRIEAIMCLGYAEAQDSGRVMEKALFDPDEDISYFSMIALGQIKNVKSVPALLALFKKKTSSRYKISSMLETFPEGIIEDLMKMADDPDPIIRLWTLRMASRFKMGPHIEKIREMTRDDSAEVRAAVCSCLAITKGPKNAKTLEGCLKDDAWIVRASAVKALSCLLKDEAVPFIINLISDASLSVLENVREAIADHIETALPYLEKILYGDDAMARRISVEAIEGSGYIDAILKKFISGPGAEKKRAAHLLMGMVKSGANVGLEGAVWKLDEPSREKALEAIGEVDPELADHIMRRLRGEIIE